MNLSLSISVSGAHRAALPFVLSSANIDEDATQTDVVGALSSTHGTGPYTYSIVADPDSKFAISGSNLVVRTAATFNYETATSHSVTIRSTDSLAATEDRVFTISVNNVADGPTTTGAASDLATELAGLEVDVLTTFDLRTLFVSPTSQTLTFEVPFGTIAGDGFTWSYTPTFAEYELYGEGNLDFYVIATDEDGQSLEIEWLNGSIALTNQAPAYSNTDLVFEVPEGTGPAIASSNPADNGTGVSIAADPTVTFDRPIKFLSSGTITLYNKTDTVNHQVFTVPTDVGSGPGTISISGNVLTVRPTSDFGNSKNIAWLWAGGPFGNLGGIAVADLSDNTVLDFTTIAAAPSDVSTHSTLTTGLVSYWDLGEASGTRADSHGSNTLADNNTVTSTTGIGGSGTAALFASANSEYLSITDAAQSGLDLAGPLSMNIWYKPTTNVSTANVIGKWNGGASQASYRGSVSTSGAALGILLSTNGSFQASNSKNQSITTLTTGTWYMLTWVFDRTAGEVTFYLNGSSVGTATGVTTSALFDGTSDFRIGCTGAGSEFMDAAAQFAGVWSKTLTTQEITDLYNAGAGLPYAA